MKTRALVEAMGRMGYRATGLGERDLTRGYDYVDTLRKAAGFPFLSGNTIYQKTGKPVFDQKTIITLSSKDFKNIPGKNVKVGVTSFLRFNPTFLKPTPNGDNMILGTVNEEAKKIIPELRKQCDLVIVLTSMPKDDAHLLARGVPGIDLILAAYGGMVTAGEELEGTTRIVYLGTQGKQLAEVRAMKAPGGWQTTQNIHYLSATYPEEPRVRAAVAAALNEINEKNRKVAEERAAKQAQMVQNSAAADAGGSSNRTYLGSEACRDCHAREYQIWKLTKHAHAFDILVAKKSEFNPECVGCHVVGYRARGGFEDAKNTPAFVHVQCESCHGPASTHPENPTLPYGRAGGEASCKSCHTHENSPSFEFAAYWPKVQH